ncbi:MAG TPA: deoxyribose-phosphate aldolase [Terriglobales bacterium]|nr:deoxyribose-phosphate aldolase [Terriglobales bacterium]
MSQLLTDPHIQLTGWQTMAGCIDHTLLKADATREQIIRLCEEAMFFRFVAVCVNPYWISLAASCLNGSGIRVAATVGFPLGANSTTMKCFETEEAIRLGAAELEIAMNVGALKSGDRLAVQTDVSSVVQVAHERGAMVKVIVETPLLNLEEKILACQICLAAGADFVKTATGFLGGASAEDVSLLRGVVGDRAGVKASGGVRSAATAQAMLEAGATRVGTSSGVAILQELGAYEFHGR